MMNNDSTKKEWLDITEKTIAKIRKEKELYKVNIQDKEIVIYPNVFSPKHFADVDFFAKSVPKIVKNGSLLEVGVGTGVVLLFSALNGATKAVGTDINPEAIKNTKENFNTYGLEVDLFEGDVFGGVPENSKFDYIFWNHPFNYTDEPVEDYLLRSVYDSKYEGLKIFFRDADKYLADDGVLILGSGDLANQEDVLAIASENNWECFDTKESESTHRIDGATPMGLYIYQFRKRT